MADVKENIRKALECQKGSWHSLTVEGMRVAVVVDGQLHTDFISVLDEHRNQIASLNLSRSHIIIVNLPVLSTLTDLNLSHNNISGMGLDCLASLVSLKRLDLSYNRIETVTELDPLKDLPLNSLDLTMCPINTGDTQYRSEIYELIHALVMLDGKNEGGIDEAVLERNEFDDGMGITGLEDSSPDPDLEAIGLTGSASSGGGSGSGSGSDGSSGGGSASGGEIGSGSQSTSGGESDDMPDPDNPDPNPIIPYPSHKRIKKEDWD